MLFLVVVCFFHLSTLEHTSSRTVFLLLGSFFDEFFFTLPRVSIRLAALAFLADEEVFDLVCPMLLFQNLVKFRSLIIFGFLDLFECGVDDAEEDVEENELEGDHDQYVDARSHVWVAIVHFVDHALVLHDDQYHSNDRRPDSAELLLDISVEKLAAAAIPKKHDH